MVNCKDTGVTISFDRNTVVIPLRTTTQVHTGTGTSVPPISIGLQKIEIPRRPIISQEVRNAEPLDASINIITSKQRDLTPSWSKVISSRTFTNEISDVYACGRMNFGSDTVLFKNLNFVDLGLSTVNTTDQKSLYISSLQTDYLNLDSRSGCGRHSKRANTVQTKCTFCGGVNQFAEKCFKRTRQEK